MEPAELTSAECAPINRVTIKIPPFWADEPELWFAQLERQFTLGRITSDETKYAYVLAQVDTKQAKEIKDLITQPPEKNKYESIKKALIQRLSISQEQQIRQLLEHEEMGDRRPSQFLRHLQSLASSAISEQLLRTLWMGRLPSQLQAILATRTADNLEVVAEQADRIYEITCRTAVVASTQATTTEQTMEQQIKILAQQVASLNSRLTQSLQKDRRRSRSRTRSGNHKEEKNSDGVCFYHKRFKDKAKKCVKPCSFKKEEN
ncbi:uncharacterized protein LOC118646355 [Monomorium pharaonis]|uniref:uncharacterized protein LOC118646355 n=1 Tax=Monomorium pharaonis TaxID=307658 RepID=UPI001746CD93|nr:uncharacterized protein LOC118646355 [Monomorium pharaonis]